MSIVSTITNAVKDKNFWLNFVIAMVFYFITAVIILYSLKFVTKYGESAVIPNMKNMSLEQAYDTLDILGLNYVVQDTVYNKDVPEGTVVDVQPDAGLEVKSGREVRLIISTKRPSMVEMPNLVGRSSLRFAKIELETRGLSVGSLTFVPSTEKDAVLAQKIGDLDIKPGTKIPKGTTINLVLGDGLTGVALTPPFLIGKRYGDVIELLAVKGLTANYYFTGDITDSMSAVVYKQYPSLIDDEKINVGEPMDVFISQVLPKNILKDSALKARLMLEEQNSEK